MTKLMEWLFAAVVLLGAWTATISWQLKSSLPDEYLHITLLFPIIVLVLFGLYAATVVLWRVYTFNDCEEAAEELQKQIQQAKADLRLKGLRFSED